MSLFIINIKVNPRCRDSQLFEVLQFVEQTRGADPVILVGDFNTKPRHTAYSLLTRCLRLHDVFEKDPVDTCDLTSNIFTDRKRMTPKRIDFILYSDEFATSHTIHLKVRWIVVVELHVHNSPTAHFKGCFWLTKMVVKKGWSIGFCTAGFENSCGMVPKLESYTLLNFYNLQVLLWDCTWRQLIYKPSYVLECVACWKHGKSWVQGSSR